MSMPSPFEMGRAIGGNISGDLNEGFENNRIDQILKQAQASGDPAQIKNVMNQVLTHVSPEKRPAVMSALQQNLNRMGDTSTEAGYQHMMRQRDIAGQFENYATPLLAQHNVSPEESQRFFEASKQFENIPNLQERFAKTAKLLSSQQQTEGTLFETGERPRIFGSESEKIKDIQPLIQKMKSQGFDDKELVSKLEDLGHGKVEIDKMLYPMSGAESDMLKNIGQQANTRKDKADYAASQINRMITPKTSMLAIYEKLLQSGMARDQISKTFENIIKSNPNLSDRQLRQIAEIRTQARKLGPQRLMQKLDKIFGVKR